MAQLVKTRRSSSHSPRTQTSPTFEQLLRVEDTYWTPRASLPKNDNDVHFEEDNMSSPVHNKKSVLTKVKERAMKLRHSLSGNGNKKQGNEHTGDIIKTPSTGVTTLDGDELNKDPEYHGAPMYESEAAPDTYKETDTQHPRAVPVVSSKEHVLADNIERENDTVGPAESKIVGATPEAQGTPPTTTHDIPSEVKIMNESNKWDKGVSVKEYFMNKLEPVDDDDRALSEAITDAISPTKTSGDSGVVEKVKDAVSSFFWHEDNSSSPNIPISTQVTEEENHGKILQAN